MLVTERGLTRLLKVTCGCTFSPTPVLPFCGSTPVTVGTTKSMPGPVVKFAVTVLVIRLPALSCTPVIDRV